MFELINSNKSKRIIALSALFAIVFVLACNNIRLIRYWAIDFTWLFSIIQTALVVAFALSIWLIFKKQKNHITILVVWAVALSVGYLFMFPPVTVPDEPLHYLSAYRISNYFLLDFSQINNPNLCMRQCDREFFDIVQRDISGGYIKSIYGDYTFFAAGSPIIQCEADYVANAPFGYIPSALGIAIARLFALSPINTFILGRLMNVAVFGVMLMFAVKRTPIGKLAVAVIALMPIVLHLAASFSYDALTIAFALCFMAQLMYIIDSNKPASKGDLVLLFVFSVLLAPSKLVYLPLVFMLIIIPSEKLGLSKKRAVILKLVALAVILAIFFILQLSTFMETVNDTQTGIGEVPSYSVGWILSNPFLAIRVLRDTVVRFGSMYVGQMFSKTLSWLNVNLSSAYCGAFAVLILFSFIKRKGETTSITFTQKAFITLLALASVGLIFLSMFIAVTPNDSDVILGIQGRYFIPLLVPAYLVLRNKFITVRPGVDKYLAVAAIGVSVLSIAQLFITVTGRVI